MIWNRIKGTTTALPQDTSLNNRVIFSTKKHREPSSTVTKQIKNSVPLIPADSENLWHEETRERAKDESNESDKFDNVSRMA